MKRSVMVKLQPSKEEAKILNQLADAGAKAWNRVNYLRRQQYFQERIVDFNKTEKTVYEEFKREIGSATVQQIARRTLKPGGAFSHSLEKSGMVNYQTGLSQDRQATSKKAGRENP